MESGMILFDRNAFLDMLYNDDALLCEIVNDYLADSQRIVAELTDLLGSERVGDNGELLRLVHTLKGSSANVHAIQVRELAARLEEALMQQKPVDQPELLCQMSHALEEFAFHVRTLYPDL